jgi:hypothetical protein
MILKRNLAIEYTVCLENKIKLIIRMTNEPKKNKLPMVQRNADVIAFKTILSF